MSKITFSNGKTVNFNGNPTPADIQAVAKSLGITNATPQADAANPTPTPTPITTPDQTPTQPHVNPILGAANAIGGALGIKKAGQGIATAARVATGSINQTGDDEGRALGSTQAVISKLNDLIKQGVPASNLQRMQLVNYLKGQAGQAVPTQAEIDPGTTLSNKEVLGSFGNVALNAVGGAGALEGADAATQVARPLLEGGGTAAKVARNALLGYGYDVANHANNNDADITKAGAGTILGAALPIATKVGGAIAQRVLGITSGVGKDVVQRAVENPDAVASAIKEYATTPEAKQSLVDRAKSAIGSYLHDRGEAYGEEISNMTASAPIDKDVVTNSFKDNIKGFGARIDNDGNLAFKDSKLTNTDQRNLSQAWNDIKNWTNVTPQGFDDLRQNISNHMDDFSAAGNSRANAILGNVKKDLTTEISSKVDSYAGTLKDYGDKTATAKNLLNELNLKSGNARESTQLKSVLGIFKKDPKVLGNLSETMGTKGAESFLNEISGAILSDWIPNGKVGNAIRGVGEAGLGFEALHGSPHAAAAAIATLPAFSPRVVGAGATIAGRAIRAGVGVAARRAAINAASKLTP